MKTVLILLSLVVIASLSACNTVKGVGKDTERAGEIIQKEAEQHIDDKQQN
jgi:entericidin B